MNNLPKVVTQQRRGRGSNPRLLDRKSDALPLSHRANPFGLRTKSDLFYHVIQCVLSVQACSVRLVLGLVDSLFL